MPLPTVSFLLGLLVLAYLLTFVVFAILRIATGVSIQRVGYSGFRHIAFNLRHGVDISIRGVGLSVHRPTFALPTWCSLVITELVVTIDLQALEKSRSSASGTFAKSNGHAPKETSRPSSVSSEADFNDIRGALWKRLTTIKEKIKTLHTKINWIRLVDFVVTGLELNVRGVGALQIERAMLSVDTRTKTVDRTRLFQHHKKTAETSSPAEWKSLIRSVLFTPDGRDSTEVLDYATVNIYGMLRNELRGLRDASIGIKLGRLNVPWDDFAHAKKSADLLRGKYAQPEPDAASFETMAVAIDDLTQNPDAESDMAKDLSESRAFIASILRGIHEFQFAIGSFGLTRRMNIESDSGRDVYFNLAMKEFGLDVLRLDSKSPAHRMYFSPKDVAHQGLLTAIAISAGIDDGHDHPERMVYIPMVTATVRTTLPSRTLHYQPKDSANDRNLNMFYANFVCTSPSIDLDPKHLPLVREMLKQRSSPTSSPRKSPADRHQFIAQLLPKAFVKMVVQEPVIRVALPPIGRTNAEEGDFDLLISSSSLVLLEIQSSHATDDNLHYDLSTRYRHTQHQVYYQTNIEERHDLLQSESVEVRVDVNAIPDASVVVSGRFQTFTCFLVRPEICEGVRQIMRQLRKNVLSRHTGDEKPSASFVRRIPEWLTQCRIEGSDFGIELAAMDEEVSKDTRGLAIQLESWTTEYRAHRENQPDMFTRRSSISRGSALKEPSTHARERSPRKKFSSVADGRRLTLHLQNLEGFVIDSIPQSQPESFMSLPRFEVAFSTRTDSNGPAFHINSHAKSVLLQYSLYNFFAISLAANVIKNTFLERIDGQTDTKQAKPRKMSSLTVPDGVLTNMDGVARYEVTIIDFKSSMVQLKAKTPADPPMMLQLFELETGQHRWGIPFLRAKLARLCVRAPRTKEAWARIVSIKVLRLDLRDLKRKAGDHHVAEKSIDLATDMIRFSVPHSLVVHSIFDNVTNIIKTTKQLNHHFKTGNSDYILTKEPEGPKHVPRITFRTQLLIFALDDSSFEWKLNAIYRAGMIEQKQRWAREEAFKLKEKRLARNTQRSASTMRSQSTHADQRSRSQTRKESINVGKQRSRSSQPNSTPVASASHPHQQQRPRHHNMRYDTAGRCVISDTSRLAIETAREKLDVLNAQSWKNRIDHVLSFQSNTMREIREMVWGLEELPDGVDQDEPILALNQRPGLLLLAAHDLNITVDKPSFPIEDYPKFLHEVGKGMPKDMQYGLLIPMNLHVTMGELRLQLRDYPLPLLHVPALAGTQSHRLPALSMRTDFVIAEEFRDVESQRQVNVQVVPPERMGTKKGFDIPVQRTISPVKTYSNMKFEINTSRPTKITWGTSYQPAIQDAMQVIEGFTKPPVDPSDRVGFWDKIRLSFHSRVNVAWKGDGDVHLILKGSRDPYIVTGNGAGLVMVWRNDVQWNIARHDDPRQFMTVDSADFILAVPDFNNYARRVHNSDNSDDASLSSSSTGSGKRDAIFKKVVMKLSGNVQWLAGMVFERDLKDGKRSFDFKPHYDVVLKHPDFAVPSDGREYDAYQDFRSNHIHMSVAVAAPRDRQWSVGNLKPSNNYNAIHLTPRFFAHFLNWWSMFSGVMSLPIRQGPLWGAMLKKSKKFGRHVATFKYNLLLSPLYVSHVYKHKDAEDYKDSIVSATGLKMRLDSFMLDMHQRREYFDIKGHEGAQSKQSSGLRINQAQLDFINADLRALSASIAGTSVSDIEKASEGALASLYGQVPSVDMSKFEIPDQDLDWIDMDDFVELDWILPAESDPQTKILPLGYAPRFTYFRQTDHGGVIAGDETRTTPFGDEPTHYCVMSARNDPRRVQAELIRKRLATLKDHQSRHEHDVGEHELKVVRSSHGEKASAEKLHQLYQKLQSHSEHLRTTIHFLEDMLKTLEERLETDDPSAVPDLETSEEFFEAHESSTKTTEENANLNTAPLADYTSDFNNRFIVHNAQIKWNNSLRNIILRYIHQNSQRRGFVYYMSQRAVKFILDIIEEKRKAEASEKLSRTRTAGEQSSTPASPDADDEETIQDRIDQLLRDGRSFVNADEVAGPDTEVTAGNENKRDDIDVEYTALNTYHFRLIAPQVQLQSEKNPKAVVLVTSKGMQLKVVTIMDKNRIGDDVSGLVQRRFTAAADSMQMFVTTVKTFTVEHLHTYSTEAWGAKKGTFWPPWVPLEIVFEFHNNPYGFNRVIDQTSASVRYDKYNTLRLKYNNDVSGDGSKHKAPEDNNDECHMNHIWVEFPQLRAICDSAQYYALYIIVMDLLLYNEPLEKTRSERLEKIMLASDFSDLSGAPEMVRMLQERIRQLEEIKMHFQVNEKYLDRQGWKDRISMDQDLASCEDELFFMMKAITTSQQRIEDRRENDDVAGLLHMSVSSKEIVWHLTRDKGESLMEFQLKDASYDRTVNNDGSNYNSMEIGRINGLNLLPNAIYPDIIAPFVDENRGIFDERQGRMLRVHWLMLEAIAGIPVVDYFEIDLVPLKLQVEREVARKVFEYIFPGHSSNEGSGFSPFMVKHMLPTKEEEDGDDSNTSTELTTPVDEAPEPAFANGKTSSSIESRLRPTLHLPNKAAAKGDGRSAAVSSGTGHLHGIGLGVHHPDKSRSSVHLQSARANASRQALSSVNNAPALSRSTSDRSVATMRSEVVNGDNDNKRSFSLRRSQSHDRHKDHSRDKDRDRDREKDKDGVKDKDKDHLDDLTQMIDRASNYMTLAFVKVPSVVLCLSYRGQGKRNIEDVHDLVFRMPTLEYRNKTWSNLDLALQLKKDIIRALISHAGAIVGNKFSHHRPSKQQLVKLREIANKNTSMSPATSRSVLSSTETDSTLQFPSFESLRRPSTASAGVFASNGAATTDSTPSASSADLPAGGTAETSSNGQTNGNSPERSSSLSVLGKSFQPVDSESRSRSRQSSISRHLSLRGDRWRPRQADSEDTDESKRKSKLLLGGQKLFRTLREQ